MTPADDRAQDGPGTGGPAAPQDVDAAAGEKPQVKGDDTTNEDDEPKGSGPAARVAGGDMVAKMAQMNSSR